VLVLLDGQRSRPAGPLRARGLAAARQRLAAARHQPDRERCDWEWMITQSVALPPSHASVFIPLVYGE